MLDNNNVFIDSGIFALTNNHKRKYNITMDEALALSPNKIEGFSKLYDKYVELLTKYGDRSWGYIELDQGGRENKKKTRKKLEDAGLRPIPVYHPFNDGWDYFDELAENYDRICFGNVVQARGVERMKLIATAYNRHREYPDLWIHLLGYQVNELMNALPVDSCDSSSWLSGTKWGQTREYSLGRIIGNLEDEYIYRLGNTDQCKVAAVLSGIIANNLGENWKEYIRRLKDVGIDAYS